MKSVEYKPYLHSSAFPNNFLHFEALRSQTPSEKFYMLRNTFRALDPEKAFILLSRSRETTRKDNKHSIFLHRDTLVHIFT